MDLEAAEGNAELENEVELNVEGELEERMDGGLPVMEGMAAAAA